MDWWRWVEQGNMPSPTLHVISTRHVYSRYNCWDEEPGRRRTAAVIVKLYSHTGRADLGGTA